MPKQPLNADLHGNAPDKSPVVLLLIDVLTDLDFPGADQLLQHAFPMAQRLVRRWRSDFRAQVEHCLERDTLGRPLVELLLPEDDDHFVLKPKHSGFFSTTLDVLLRYLGAETLILSGIAANICVLF